LDRHVLAGPPKKCLSESPEPKDRSANPNQTVVHKRRPNRTSWSGGVFSAIQPSVTQQRSTLASTVVAFPEMIFLPASALTSNRARKD
jgi:hypothetical protein